MAYRFTSHHQLTNYIPNPKPNYYYTILISLQPFNSKSNTLTLLPSLTFQSYQTYTIQLKIPHSKPLQKQLLQNLFHNLHNHPQISTIYNIQYIQNIPPTKTIPPTPQHNPPTLTHQLIQPPTLNIHNTPHHHYLNPQLSNWETLPNNYPKNS